MAEPLEYRRYRDDTAVLTAIGRHLASSVPFVDVTLPAKLADAAITTRRSLPNLTCTSGTYDQGHVDDLVSQLSDLSWPHLSDASGNDQQADAIAGLREILPLIRSGQTADAEQADAALACFENLIDSMLDEPYSEVLRRRVESIRPVVIRVALSTAIGLLATAATSPLAGDSVLIGLLASAIGLLVTATCTELLVNFPRLLGTPESSAPVDARQQELLVGIGELNDLLRRASDPDTTDGERQRWHAAVQRSVLALQITTVHLDHRLRFFLWSATPEYVALLTELRTLLFTVRNDTSDRQVSIHTRRQLRDLGRTLAAYRIPPDFVPLDVPSLPPPRSRPVARTTVAGLTDDMTNHLNHLNLSRDALSESVQALDNAAALLIELGLPDSVLEATHRARQAAAQASATSEQATSYLRRYLSDIDGGLTPQDLDQRGATPPPGPVGAPESPVHPGSGHAVDPDREAVNAPEPDERDSPTPAP